MTKLFYLIPLTFTLLAFGVEDCPNCQTELYTFYPMPEPPEWPIEFVKVYKENYERNENTNYCKRPPEMVDTIVIHHSQTPSVETPQDINRIHLERGWYMVGYSYAINSAYPGNSQPLPKVTEARPMDLVGAHAGSEVFVQMDKDQKQIWDEGKVVCGSTGQEFTVDPELVQKDKIKANVTTIGLVIIGNYAPFSISNPGGYRKGNPLNPTKETLILTAKMSCQLQKKYPRIKNIKWHALYHSTTCPGTLKNFIGQIKSLAKGYGCEFN